MPVRKQDAHRALELLEEYRRNLTGPGTEDLREALTKAIVAIRSRLFQALLDIHDFYSYTLEDAAKTTQVKTEETLTLAERWEKHPPPVPTETRDLAEKALDAQRAEQTDSSDQDEWEELSIDLQRGPTGGLGVSVAGGSDNPHVVGNPGIFVTKLIPDTPASQDGRLRLGDRIMSVNGKSLVDVRHMEAVQTLKDSGNEVHLVVHRKKGDGMLWKPPTPTPLPTGPTGNATSHYITIVLEKKEKGLGFSIAGGQGNQHVLGDDGIFVTKIIPGAAAEEEGTLATGDRILKVNDESLVDVTHEQAVTILKNTPHRVVLEVEKDAIHRSSSEKDGVDSYGERVVTLTRSEGEGLGFNIIGGEGDTGIFVSYISPSSVAEKAGELKPGDHILEVNGTDIRDANHDDAAKAFKGAGTTVNLLVQYDPVEFKNFQDRLQRLQDMSSSDQQQPEKPSRPSIQPEPEPVKQLYVRALFDYDSSKDDDRPSQGLSFKHGDILHILNGGDEEWWQAAVVGNHADDGPQGLVPSKKRIERRALANQKSVKFTRSDQPVDGEKDRKSSTSEKEARRGLRSSFKLSRKLPFIKKADSGGGGEQEAKAEGEHVPSYEPVTLEPRGYARPVIILGPLKEDINDLLVQEFPDKFAGCVPHTTREPREGEVDGRDYHFVSSVEQMEKDIQAHLFIEAGRYKDNLYGTSIRAVQEVAQQGKHCILGVSGYAIRRLQMADLHPIAICIRPASVDVIQTAQPRSTEEQCRSIFEKGERIEQEFAEYFTAVVEGGSLDDMYNRVKNVIHEQSGNYIWVPSSDPV